MKKTSKLGKDLEGFETDSNPDNAVTAQEEIKQDVNSNQEVVNFKVAERPKDELSACLGPVQIYFTIFKGLVGIGVLYLPKGFTYSGWLTSVIALMICGVFTLEGLNRQIRSHEKAGGGYPELAEKAGGILLRIFLEICVVTVQVFLKIYIDNVRYWLHNFHSGEST